jgi:hypothetical protein
MVSTRFRTILRGYGVDVVLIITCDGAPKNAGSVPDAQVTVYTGDIGHAAWLRSASAFARSEKRSRAPLLATYSLRLLGDCGTLVGPGGRQAKSGGDESRNAGRRSERLAGVIFRNATERGPQSLRRWYRRHSVERILARDQHAAEIRGEGRGEGVSIPDSGHPSPRRDHVGAARPKHGCPLRTILVDRLHLDGQAAETNRKPGVSGPRAPPLSHRAKRRWKSPLPTGSSRRCR